jgi:hypothetical protein
MFFAHSSSILFTVLTVLAAGAAAVFVPMLIKKAGANKYFSQTSIDIVVGLLAAYAIVGLITLLAGLLVWLSNVGPLGYNGQRW